jgi:hypothetical protein
MTAHVPWNIWNLYSRGGRPPPASRSGSTTIRRSTFWVGPFVQVEAVGNREPVLAALNDRARLEPDAGEHDQIHARAVIGLDDVVARELAERYFCWLLGLEQQRHHHTLRPTLAERLGDVFSDHVLVDDARKQRVAVVDFPPADLLAEAARVREVERISVAALERAALVRIAGQPLRKAKVYASIEAVGVAE